MTLFLVSSLLALMINRKASALDALALPQISWQDLASVAAGATYQMEPLEASTSLSYALSLVLTVQPLLDNN